MSAPDAGPNKGAFSASAGQEKILKTANIVMFVVGAVVGLSWSLEIWSFVYRSVLYEGPGVEVVSTPPAAPMPSTQPEKTPEKPEPDRKARRLSPLLPFLEDGSGDAGHDSIIVLGPGGPELIGPGERHSWGRQQEQKRGELEKRPHTGLEAAESQERVRPVQEATRRNEREAGVFLDMVRKCRNDAVKDWAQLLGRSVDEKNGHGRTALSVAAEAGCRSTVELLLNHKADINLTDLEGLTPLMWAVRGGNLDTIELLVRAGADLKARDKRGRTALDWVRDISGPRSIAQK